MIVDANYQKTDFQNNYLEQHYGDNIKLINSPYAQTLLAIACEQQSVVPKLNHLIQKLYQILLNEAFNQSFKQEIAPVKTRMMEFTTKGEFSASFLQKNPKVISVNLARAGAWPSHICFEACSEIFDPSLIRQDHIYINRKTDDSGKVIGQTFSGSKIGGDKDQAYVLFPDPMGATGGSLSRCVSHYKDEVKGSALKFIALHLIITPEYIKRMQTDHPDVEIYALRLDRGNSSEKALASIPGLFADEESGLTDIQYIVPGAGGMGEVLNNSFV